MELIIDGCLLRDCSDQKSVVQHIIRHVGHEFFDYKNISRSMAVIRDGQVCGYFLTCNFLGVKSFHGFKFCTGDLAIQFKLTRKYIELENLLYSGYRNKESGVVLRALGFKEIFHINGITIVKRTCS